MTKTTIQGLRALVEAAKTGNLLNFGSLQVDQGVINALRNTRMEDSYAVNSPHGRPVPIAGVLTLEGIFHPKEVFQEEGDSLFGSSGNPQRWHQLASSGQALAITGNSFGYDGKRPYADEFCAPKSRLPLIVLPSLVGSEESPQVVVCTPTSRKKKGFLQRWRERDEFTSDYKTALNVGYFSLDGTKISQRVEVDE